MKLVHRYRHEEAKVLASPSALITAPSFTSASSTVHCKYNVLNQHPSFPGFVGPLDASDADRTRGSRRILPFCAHQADFHKGHILGQRFSVRTKAAYIRWQVF
jgi:hypothetical protein